jgi:hypothetical protein
LAQSGDAANLRSGDTSLQNNQSPITLNTEMASSKEEASAVPAAQRSGWTSFVKT